MNKKTLITVILLLSIITTPIQLQNHIPRNNIYTISLSSIFKTLNTAQTKINIQQNIEIILKNTSHFQNLSQISQENIIKTFYESKLYLKINLFEYLELINEININENNTHLNNILFYLIQKNIINNKKTLKIIKNNLSKIFNKYESNEIILNSILIQLIDKHIIETEDSLNNAVIEILKIKNINITNHNLLYFLIQTAIINNIETLDLSIKTLNYIHMDTENFRLLNEIINKFIMNQIINNCEDFKNYSLMLNELINIISSSNYEKIFSNTYWINLKNQDMDIKHNLEFYIKIIKKYDDKKLMILKNIIDAIKNDDMDVDSNGDEIIQYIDVMNNFHEGIFKIYSNLNETKKEKFLNLIKDFWIKIVKDEIGKEEIIAFKKSILTFIPSATKEDISNFLLETIMITIPPYIEDEMKDKYLDLIQQGIDYHKDTREDIPLKVKNINFGNVKIPIYFNQSIDKKNKVIENLFNILSMKQQYTNEKINNKNILLNFIEYIKKYKPFIINNFNKQLQNKSYFEQLNLLQNFLTNKNEGVFKYFDEYIETINLETKQTKQTLVNIKYINKQYKNILSLNNINENNKADKINKIISVLDYENKKYLISLLGKNNPELLKNIKTTENQNHSQAKNKNLQTELINHYQNIINIEKNRMINSKFITLNFRVVKGIPYRIYGANSKICTWQDNKLFEKSNFSILSIINEETKEILGSINLFIIDDNNQQYLIAIGINPIIEKINISIKTLVNIIEKVLINIGQKISIQNIAIVNEKNMISNIKNIEKEIIKRKHYKIQLSKKYEFSTTPRYLFKNIFKLKNNSYIEIFSNKISLFLKNKTSKNKSISLETLISDIGFHNSWGIIPVFNAIFHINNDSWKENYIDISKVKNILSSI